MCSVLSVVPNRVFLLRAVVSKACEGAVKKKPAKAGSCTAQSRDYFLAASVAGAAGAAGAAAGAAASAGFAASAAGAGAVTGAASAGLAASGAGAGAVTGAGTGAGAGASFLLQAVTERARRAAMRIDLFIF